MDSNVRPHENMAPQEQTVGLADSPAGAARAPPPPVVRALILFQVVGVAVFLIGLLGALVYQDELRESFRATINGGQVGAF